MDIYKPHALPVVLSLILLLASSSSFLPPSSFSLLLPSPTCTHVQTPYPTPHSPISRSLSRISPPRSCSHPLRAPNLAAYAFGLPFIRCNADVCHRPLHVSTAQHRLLSHHAQGRGLGRYARPKRRAKEGNGGFVLVSEKRGGGINQLTKTWAVVLVQATMKR